MPVKRNRDDTENPVLRPSYTKNALFNGMVPLLECTNESALTQSRLDHHSQRFVEFVILMN
jgi:hypothetical protein